MRLSEFIVEAKRSGYASSGETNELRFTDGSSGFVFQVKGFRYLDRYYGFNPFSGSEVVFETNIPIWSMNYYGQSNLPTDETKELYIYLRKVLILISPDFPFRGPAKHKEGKYEYDNLLEGDMNRFKGIETITIDGEEV